MDRYLERSNKVEVKLTTAHEKAPKTIWMVGYLDVANRDAARFLNEDQIAHLRMQILDLAYVDDPRRCESQDVSQIGDFFELRDKGGILANINARIFFALFNLRRLIVVLGCFKKEAEGKTPNHIVVRMRNRLREAKKAISRAGKDGP